jgi:hypothetical protein
MRPACVPLGTEHVGAIKRAPLPSRKEAARSIALFAGAIAAEALLGQDVIYEVRMIQYPVVLGDVTS